MRRLSAMVECMADFQTSRSSPPPLSGQVAKAQADAVADANLRVSTAVEEAERSVSRVTAEADRRVAETTSTATQRVSEAAATADRRVAEATATADQKVSEVEEDARRRIAAAVQDADDKTKDTDLRVAEAQEVSKLRGFPRKNLCSKPPKKNCLSPSLSLSVLNVVLPSRYFFVDRFSSPRGSVDH